MTENENAVEISPLSAAEDAVNTISRDVSQAFKTFVKLPNIPNTDAVVAAMDNPDLVQALFAYRKAYAAKHFS